MAEPCLATSSTQSRRACGGGGRARSVEEELEGWSMEGGCCQDQSCGLHWALEAECQHWMVDW